jgi:hypothetical protein
MNEMMEVVPLMDSSDEDEDIVSIGSNSTSSTGGKSTFETTFNQEMIAREEEDNLIIDSVSTWMYDERRCIQMLLLIHLL